GVQYGEDWANFKKAAPARPPATARLAMPALPTAMPAIRWAPLAGGGGGSGGGDGGSGATTRGSVAGSTGVDGGWSGGVGAGRRDLSRASPSSMTSARLFL